MAISSDTLREAIQLYRKGIDKERLALCLYEVLDFTTNLKKLIIDEDMKQDIVITLLVKSNKCDLRRKNIYSFWIKVATREVYTAYRRAKTKKRGSCEIPASDFIEEVFRDTEE
jgi:DNA-directed RNA polymerase specialized sigma24 family protein